MTTPPDAQTQQRLSAVEDLRLLDRIGDPVLTGLTRLTQSVTGASTAAVHIFDAEYQRRIAASGAPLVDYLEGDTMCRIVVLGDTRVITSDATSDGRFDYMPFKTMAAPVRFYAGVPLRVGGGVAVGTLCAFDTESRELTDEQIWLLEDIAEIARAHLELIKVAAELGHAATLDPLTGAVNRVIFDDRLAQGLARRRRHHTAVLVALIDLDNFKALNDTHGHGAGDDALKWVAKRLHELIRREGDTIGRLGGDEFGIVAEVSDRAASEALVAEIRSAAQGFEPAFTLGVGAVLADDDDDVETVLQRADEAMYVDKRRRSRHGPVGPIAPG